MKEEELREQLKVYHDEILVLEHDRDNAVSALQNLEWKVHELEKWKNAFLAADNSTRSQIVDEFTVQNFSQNTCNNEIVVSSSVSAPKNASEARALLRLDEALKELQKIRADKEEIRSKLRACESNLFSVQEASTSFQELLKAQNFEINEIKIAHEQKCGVNEQLATELKLINDETKYLKTERESLGAALSALQLQCDSLRMENKTLLCQVQSLNSEKTSLQSVLAELKQQIVELENSLLHAREAEVLSRKFVDEQRRSLDDSAAALQNETRAKQTLQSQVSQRDKDIKEKTETIASLQSDLKKYESEKKVLSDSEGVLRRELQFEKEASEATKQQLTKTTRQLNTLQSEYGALQTTKAELDSLLVKTREKEESLSRREDVAKRMNDGLEKKVIALKANREIMQQEYNAGLLARQEAERALEVATRESKKWERDYTRLQKRVALLEQNLNKDPGTNAEKLASPESSTLSNITSASSSEVSTVQARAGKKEEKKNAGVAKKGSKSATRPVDIDSLQSLLEREKQHTLYSMVICLILFLISVSLAVALFSKVAT